MQKVVSSQYSGNIARDQSITRRTSCRLRLLITHRIICRVDVGIQDNFKWTALHHASHASQEDIVRFLLAANAEIDVQGMNGGMRDRLNCRPFTIPSEK